MANLKEFVEHATKTIDSLLSPVRQELGEIKAQLNKIENAIAKVSKILNEQQQKEP